MIRGQDYAIDLCGALDVLKPAILLMIKCQAVNILPWKIVSWLPHLLSILEAIKMDLLTLSRGEIDLGRRDLLPTLKNHWEEINGEDEEYYLFGISLYDGWLVVDRVTMRRGAEGRQETVYITGWLALLVIVLMTLASSVVI